MFHLEGKVTVITGAGSGIGKAIAERFAAQKAKVYLLDLNEQALVATTQGILAPGGQARAIACNVAATVALVRTFEEIICAAQRIALPVNTPGVAHIDKHQ